ncbi:MAG: glucose-1-phosphate thymidylyltransferase [Cytophagales bacterium]|nr:MAG: glucose-1-phosphate thymidylyltransferase [Cytophagales bacterium]TAF60050.1 MAG: glucose-1-phosphate thymidylyltransferase [Cytophagales bacterium]
MKAIIPIAGRADHYRPHIYAQPKPLVPIAGKPVIGHIIDILHQKAGVDEFIFVTSNSGRRIEQYIDKDYKNRTFKTHFVVQEQRKGSAHAVWLAQELVQNEDKIIIAFGDCIVDLDFQSFINTQHHAVATKKVSKPSLFGIVETDKNNQVKLFIEKPKIPKSNLAITGLFCVKNPRVLLEVIQDMLFTHCEGTEYYLTDALMRMMALDQHFMAYEVERWYDCGKKEGLLEANAIHLAYPGFKTSPVEDFPNNNLFIQPVKIGKNCIIQNAIIGPNVAIANNVRISNCIISESIIGSDSRIEHAILNESVVGNDAVLQGFRQSLNLGDNTEINLTS